MLIVTTEGPVFSTALVTKDFFEDILTTLIFGSVKNNGWEITFLLHKTPTVITEENISLCL